MTTLAPPRARAGATSGRARSERAEALTGWLFVAPFLILFAFFIAFPVIAAAYTAFTDMTSRDVRTPFSVDFVGLETFLGVLGDADFHRAFLNTVGFVVLCVPLSMGIGFGLALILNNGINRLRTFFRAAVYLPVITNIVAAAVIWQYAFSLTGPVNSALRGMAVDAVNWLGSPVPAFAMVVVMGVWRTLGTCMVLYLAGLQAVPTEVTEAASVDGAGPFRTLWSITLPLLRPTSLLVSVLMTVSFLNIFEEPYLLTRVAR